MAASREESPAVGPGLIPTKLSHDSRGAFSKPLAQDVVTSLGFRVAEIFWTTSALGCIRGMHFQSPPFDVRKLVWVSRGAILDVLIDLHRGPDYGAVHAFELSESSSDVIYVPGGFAHGFQALEADTTVNYAVDQPFAPDHDAGLRWDSFGFSWPREPGEISARDRGLPAFGEYDSPFGGPA